MCGDKKQAALRRANSLQGKDDNDEGRLNQLANPGTHLLETGIIHFAKQNQASIKT